MYLLFAVEAAIVILIYALARSRYSVWIRENSLRERGASLAVMPVSLWLVDRLRLGDRFSDQVGRVHQVMAGLHGAKSALARTRWFLAQTVTGMLSAILLCTLLAAVADNRELLAYGAAVSGMLPLLLYQQSSRELKRKRQDMLIELPELLNQMMLLVGAGETVPQALIRAVESRELQGGPLVRELSHTVQTIRMNGSFAKAMEDFSKRCRLQEVSLFTTTLLLNHKRGGDELLLSLKELSVTLWEKRKAVAKTLGEEASSKMVFPMVLIFFMIMVIVAAPAMLMMNISNP